MLQFNELRDAGMAELADALDLGSSAARRAGSSPVPGTRAYKAPKPNILVGGICFGLASSGLIGLVTMPETMPVILGL